MILERTEGDLYIDDGGQPGPQPSSAMPVVFVHSAGGDSTHWNSALTHLRGQGRRCVAFDLPGHGHSEAAGETKGMMDSLVEAIAAVVDHLALERFVLVGHSIGGSASMAYAGRFPQRLAGLMLVDSGGNPDVLPKEIRQQIQQAMDSEHYESVAQNYWERLLGRAKPEVREKVLAGMRKLPRRVVISQVQELFDYNPQKDLMNYRGPVLSVVVPENVSAYSVHALVPGIKHVLVEGTGHWIHLDKPDVFEEILDDFLSQVDA